MDLCVMDFNASCHIHRRVLLSRFDFVCVLALVCFALGFRWVFGVALSCVGVGLVVCFFFFFCCLDMKRRAQANLSATSEANIIHATRNIYNPSSNNNQPSFKHTRPYTFLFFLVPRNEKESYPKLYRNHEPISYMLHNKYTIHIRK